MKKLILIAVIFCCFGFAKAQESDATLKETIDWLSGKLNREFIKFQGKSLWQNCYKITFYFSWSDSTIEITKNFIFKNPEGKIGNTSNSKTIVKLNVLSLEFKSFTPDSFRTWMEITTTNRKKQVKWINGNSSGFSEYLEIYYDPDIVTFERLEKAFTHAIKLCGGKEEKF